MTGKLVVARTPEEAISAKTSEDIYLAGGTEVNRLGSNVSLNSFISIRKTSSIRTVSETDGTVTIGSACTFQELIDNELTPSYLKEALLFMASRTRRNMATIGGNIAVCRDDSFVIPTLIAANAKLVLLNKEGSTEISVWDYVSSRLSGSDAFDDDLIVSVIVPAKANVVSKRYSNTAQSHARLTVSLGYADGRFTPACAIKNDRIRLMDMVGKALDANPELSEEDLIEMVTSCNGLKLEDDLLYGSAAYRKYLLGVTVSILRDTLKEGGAL